MQSRPPALSIIITCFNYEAFIEECIESALSQNYKELEVVVIDDGSKDNSWERIQRFADRVKAVRTQNAGSLNACLTGFGLSTGDFIYFLDADDVLLPNAIEELAPYLRPDVSKIQFMLMPINKAGDAIGDGFPVLHFSEDSGRLIEAIALKGSYVTPPTSGNVYRRDVYEGLSLGDLGYEQGIDGVAYLLAPFVGRVVSIDKVLGKYRIHDSNLSSFSQVTTQSMNRYIDRFMGRLRHLDKLMTARGIESGRFEVREDYAYVLETRILGKVMGDQRPDFNLVRSYLRSLRRENSGYKLYLLMLFGLLLYILPLRIAQKLVEFRVNPSKYPRFRSKLRRSVSTVQ